MALFYDLSIPGFCPKEQLDYMAEIAKRIPKNGKIVEIGSLFGRSADCWASASDPSVTVYCIDPWQGEKIKSYIGECSIRGQFVEYANTKSQFLKFMNERNVKKIITIQNESPLKEEWQHGPVDLVYIDGAHGYREVLNDITFWQRHLKPGGIICGDDFIPDFLGVVKAVQEFAKTNDFKVSRFWKMWIFITPENQSLVDQSYSALISQGHMCSPQKILKE